MAEPFIGEIKFFSFSFSLRNWAPCDGRLIPISQNQALFSLIGTQFGGDGVTAFALPDLRGRAPLHPNAQTHQGTLAGEENVRLNLNQIPSHSHTVNASKTAGTQEEYEDAVLAAVSNTEAKLYARGDSLQPLNANTVSPAGGSQPHSNCQPSLVGNYCIALNGIFPSRN